MPPPAQAAGVPLMYGVCEFLLLTLFGVLSHYMNWTFVKREETSLVKAIFSINQVRGTERDGCAWWRGFSFSNIRAFYGTET